MTRNTPRIAAAFAQPELKSYARLGWRWLWLIVLCAVLAGAAAYVVSTTQTPIYQASSRVMINEARNPTTTNYNDILTSERMASTYANLMTRSSVLAETFTRLGLDPALVESQITSLNVTPMRDTQLVQISVESPSPDIAAAVANTLPDIFREELRNVQQARFAESKASLSEQLENMRRQVDLTRLQLDGLEGQRTGQEETEFTRLSSDLTQYQTSYTNLLQSFEELRMMEAQSTDNIVLMEPAPLPEAAVRPRKLMNTLLALVVGAMLALGVIFLIEYLDDRVRTPEDLRRIADVPVLGAVSITPGLKRRKVADSHALISVTEPRHPVTEAYRRLRTNLQFSNLDAGLRSIVITSADSSEGKSTISANLAVVMAQSGLNVLLVDADLRKPRQHAIFQELRQPGLSEALIAGELNDAFLQSVAQMPTLHLLAAGTGVPNPAEVLGSQRMRHLFAQLQERYDVVILDTPPVLAVTDAQILGQLADGVLMVVNSRNTSAGAVHRALEALVQVNVPIMGVVLNQISATGRGYDYYSYVYNHNYYDDLGSSQARGSTGTSTVPVTPDLSPQPATDRHRS